jgi:hypothetical protein
MDSAEKDFLIEKLRVQVGYLQELSIHMDSEMRKMTPAVPPLRPFIPPKLPIFVYDKF